MFFSYKNGDKIISKITAFLYMCIQTSPSCNKEQKHMENGLLAALYFMNLFSPLFIYNSKLKFHYLWENQYHFFQLLFDISKGKCENKVKREENKIERSIQCPWKAIFCKSQIFILYFGGMVFSFKVIRINSTYTYGWFILMYGKNHHNIVK